MESNPFLLLLGITLGVSKPDVSILSQKLSDFGYLQAGNLRNDFYYSEAIQQAVQDYQRWRGLEPTGTIDYPTAEALATPRCSLPDTNVAVKNPWKNRKLRCSILSMHPRIPREDQVDAIKRSISVWNEPGSLEIAYSNESDAEIRVSFASLKHGDNHPFDGNKSIPNVLAHAFYPPDEGENDPLTGDLHFDLDEKWGTRSAPSDIDLETIAIHELGHSLGLEHSTFVDSIMYPDYVGVRRRLSSTDLAELKRLYPGKTAEKLR